MHADFWLERWSKGQTGFHEREVNPLLVAHFHRLRVPPGGQVFLPLCGMTLDIDWLLARGFQVSGVELSPLAVAQLFHRLGIEPDIDTGGPLPCWRGPSLRVFVGDFFALDAQQLGAVQAVWDRAALIALPPPMRGDYTAHLEAVTQGAVQLLVTLDYDQAQMPGPPFSVDGDEVRRWYAHRSPQLLVCTPVPGGLKGRCAASECVWRIPALQPPAQ